MPYSVALAIKRMSPIVAIAVIAVAWVAFVSEIVSSKDSPLPDCVNRENPDPCASAKAIRPLSNCTPVVQFSD